MIKSKLFFAMNLNYNITLNETLKKISVLKFWDAGIQSYLYFFNIEKKKEVEKLINEEIHIEGMPNYKHDEVVLDNWKGKSGVEVIEKPDCFLVKTWQKAKGGKPQEYTEIIMKSVVMVAWDVIKELPLNGHFGARAVAQKIVRKLKLERFLDEKNNIIWHKFIGLRKKSEGSMYFTHYQTPMRILEYYGLIWYGKSISRIKENWDIQARMIYGN